MNRLPSQERFLENVVFKEIKDKKSGKVVGYKSSSPDRKSIELPADAEIEPGKPYKVRVTKDTKPEDPASGKLMAEVVKDGLPLIAERLECSGRKREQGGDLEAPIDGVRRRRY